MFLEYFRSGKFFRDEFIQLRLGVGILSLKTIVPNVKWLQIPPQAFSNQLRRGLEFCGCQHRDKQLLNNFLWNLPVVIETAQDFGWRNGVVRIASSFCPEDLLKLPVTGIGFGLVIGRHPAYRIGTHPPVNPIIVNYHGGNLLRDDFQHHRVDHLLTRQTIWIIILGF